MNRLLILLLKVTIGFILLANMDVETTYINENETFQIPGGVVPFNFSNYAQEGFGGPMNFRAYLALKTLGGAYNRNNSAVYGPSLKGNQVFDCPVGSSCFEMDLFKQFEPFPSNVSSQIVTIFKTPIYHIRMEVDDVLSFGPAENCTMYGCGPVSYLLCVRSTEVEGDTWLSVGTVFYS
jgi:hypothetical protein